MLTHIKLMFAYYYLSKLFFSKYLFKYIWILIYSIVAYKLSWLN